MLQLERASAATDRAQLARLGFREVTPLAGRALLLERIHPTSTDDGLVSLPGAVSVRTWSPANRVSRDLAHERIAVRARTRDEIPVLVHLMPGAVDDASGVRGLLAAHGIEVAGSGRAGTFTRVGALLPLAAAAEIAAELGARPDVFFVERVHRLGFFNDKSAGSVQSGRQGASDDVTPIWQRGLRGEGQIVGMIDSGLDVDGCQFRDAGKMPKVNTFANGMYPIEVDATHRKVIAYDFLYSCDQFGSKANCEMPSDPMAWDSHGHGTHCAGSMVGDREGPNRGMAPAAKMVVQDGGLEMNTCSEMPGLGCPVVDLYPIFEQAYQQGVRIHNNSYGDNEEAPNPEQSNYTARSQDVDRFVWDHKDMLIVFAAGNSGTGNSDFSVSSPSTNKNGLSVGSVRTSPTSASDDDISSFSSRGWTSDGRIKPDILAPGCTTSAAGDRNIGTNNCSDVGGCGTSYAAPILVGAAALARQYFTEGFYPSGAKNAANARDPSAALLKATLLNGAVSVTGEDNAGQAITPIPSNEQGWGRMQLDRSLVFEGGPKKLYVDDPREGFGAGDTTTISYNLRGVSAAQPLKVTLVWTDFAGMPDSPADAPRVGDAASWNASVLVNDLDLTVEAPAGLFLGNVFEGGRSQPGGMPDRRNNVEQVLLDMPAAGDVTVRVKAANIVQGAQDYALVITGQWESAAKGEAPAGGASGAGGAGGAGTGSGGAAGVAAQAGAGAAARSSADSGAGVGSLPSPGGSSASGAREPTNAAGASGFTPTEGGSPAAGSVAVPLPEPSARDDGCRAFGSPGAGQGADRAAFAWSFVLAALLLGRRRRRGITRL